MMKAPLCGMLTLAAIYFTAQTITPPTGKVGINTNAPTETLDVKGQVRIQELYTDNQQTGTNNNANFNATNVVTADDNGVLGKKSLSSIIAAQTPNFPWKKVGTTDNAVPADGLSMYSKYKTGIGDYSKSNSSISGALEVLDGPEDQFALRRGDYRWNFNAYTVNNNPFLTIVGRPNNKRLLSLSSLGALYLGSGMTDSAGSGANLILDGGTGTIGVGKNSTDYDLDVNGYTRISQLPTSNDYAKYYTTENGTRVQKTKTDKYVPAKMVVVDADGVLGKQDFPSIPTIPTEPWNKLGGTTQATANTDNIYQKGKVGIGDYTNISTFNSDFEVNSSRNGYHIGIANEADTKWNLSAENDNEKPFTITRRHSSNNGGEGRVLSLTKDTKLYLGSDIDTNGSRAKILVDGKNGKIGINKNTADHHLDVAGTAKISDNIFLNDKWNIGLKGNSLMFYSSGTKADTNNKFTLTNEGKLFLGKDMNGDGNGTGANVFLDGKDGKVAIGKNSADYKLDVAGDAKISGLKDGNGYTATHMVVADTNGVLGKANIPTIPTEPWQVAGGTTQATANNQKIYQNNKVGIGDYSSTDIGSNFEINGGGSSQLGLINGTSKWDISTEDKALTFTKRKPENGRIFSITDKAIIYLGNTLLTQNGSGAKLILDGGNGKIGINKNSADYNLDVVGDAKISGLKTTSDDITNGGTTSKYSPAKMVVADANGVLGKVDIPVIPTEPWRQLGGTNEATTNSQNIYQNGKVGIGNYTSTSSFDSDFEVSSNRNGYQIGIANGDSKWNLSTESGEERAFSITKRHPNNQGRLLSLDKDAKLYLGNTLLNTSGSGAKILVDGGQGKIGINKNTVENNYNLDVNGNTKVGGELNVTSKTTLGGELNTSNSAGTSGQVLMSKGSNQAPEWKSLKEATGVISETELKIGTTEITVSKGEEKDIPGLIYTITVSEGKEKLVMFNIVGYAAPDTFGGTQGVFELFHNGKKISSAYAAGVDTGDKYLRQLTGKPKDITTEYLAGRLMNTVVLSKIPVPATLITNVALKTGTHNFVVKYKSWYGTSKINVNATSYDGATSEDNEALLSKMLISVYNTK